MKFNVIFKTPSWDLRGVNIFSANLSKELRNSGISAFLLITDLPLQEELNYTMPLSSDIPGEKLPARN